MPRLADHERQEELLELLAPLHDEARRVARRLCRSGAEGDDLFQEAVVRALVKLPSLRDRTRFRFWFFRILVTLHTSRARRSFWRRFASFDHGEDERLEPIGDDGSAWEEERFRAARARTALARLPATHRAAVVMFEVQGFSIEEIAAIQGASIAAVKSRLARGRDQLRKFYERIGATAMMATPIIASGGGTES